MKNEITNSEDILDSRDIQERFDELTDTIQSAFTDGWNFDLVKAYKTEESKTISIVERLIKREKVEDYDFEEWQLIYNTFGELMENNSEWKYGLTFFNDDYMDEDWAEQECKDTCSIPDNLPSFIANNINWEGILEDLKQDYTTIDFDGVDYWYHDC